MATPAVAQAAVGPLLRAPEKEKTAGHLAHMIFFTGDPLKKIEPIIARLLSDNPEDILVTIVSGRAAEADEREPHGVQVMRFPGESVLHLRQRIPEIIGDAQWVILLEDHNHIDDGWLSDLRRTLAEAPEHVTAIMGGADNRTSMDPWSWANFIMVLGLHWAPCAQPPAEPLYFNVAFRRGMFPAKRFALGEFETEALARLMTCDSSATPFPIDHVQYRAFPGVLYYHWCNGRMSGAIMRQNTKDGYRHVTRHALRVVGKRMRLLEKIVKTHPKAGKLPPGTIIRTRILAVCHAAGALAGGIIGYGGAPWQLE